MFRAQGHDDRPGQGGEVDDALRLERFLRVPKHIGQHQTALGIGVDHLDRVTLHRLHDVARTLRPSIRHVFHQPDQTHDIGLGPAQRESLHHPGHHARAAHVHRHLFHAAGTLDRDAAGVKAHALADQRKGRFPLGPAIPAHHHHLGRTFRADADAEQQAHPQPFQFLFVKHLDMHAKVTQARQAVGKLDRGQHIGRFIHQIAGEEDPLRQRPRSAQQRGGGRDIGHHQRHGTARRLLARLVKVEIIGTQQQA